MGLNKNMGETTHQTGAKQPRGKLTQGKTTQGKMTHGPNDSWAKQLTDEMTR